MNFFDTHAHLQDEKFERDLDRVLDRARAAGVTRILTLGDNLLNSRKAVSLARKTPEVLAAVGVHPHAAAEYTPETESELQLLAECERVVCIGEIGLDYHHHHFGHDKQREVFRRQLALARQHRLPVSMHCRDAYADLLEDLEAERGQEIGGVCHCFSGTTQDARALVEMGFVLGVGGTCTYNRAEDLRESLAAVGIHHLILETDSPYLSPQAKRGRRNEPANLPITARTLSEMLGESYRDVERITNYNAERAFRLSREYAPQAVFINSNQIHVNLTNMCTNNCEFCARHGDGVYRGHQLLLDHDPDVDAITGSILREEYKSYGDVVFSGLGESLFRLDELQVVARAAKAAGKRVILQTNGQGLLLHGPSLWKKLEGLLDLVSVSLNAPDRDSYNAICHPHDRERAFPAVVEFIRQAKASGFPTVASAIDLPEVDLAATRRLADELGVPLDVNRRDPIFPEAVLA
ncbi:MAG: YchF/TatD family DNA exonuclease [Candidatus Sumerlaeia bacterium]|nr:YchF/TatD family DNA exonuclease [Candidatus Sumerlaeia bacterium]